MFHNHSLNRRNFLAAGAAAAAGMAATPAFGANSGPLLKGKAEHETWYAQDCDESPTSWQGCIDRGS